MDSLAPPYIPATAPLIDGWTGPVEWLDTFRTSEGVWRVSAYGSGGMANGADSARIHLDVRRREVQHLICDRMGLPAWQRESGWCAAMVWWAGVTGRAMVAVFGAWALHDSGSCYDRFLAAPKVKRARVNYARAYTDTSARYGSWSIHLPAFGTDAAGGGIGGATGDAGKTAADTAALAHDCALLNIVDGVETLTLPPITPGGSPVIWSPPCLPK